MATLALRWVVLQWRYLWAEALRPEGWSDPRVAEPTVGYWGQIGVKNSGQRGQLGQMGQTTDRQRSVEPLQVLDFVEFLNFVVSVLGAEGRRFKSDRPDQGSSRSR